MKIAIAAVALLAVSSVSCTKREPEARAQTRSAEIEKPKAPAQRPIVFLHGMCADPQEDIDAWGGAVEQHGTIVTVMGDVDCPDKPGMLKWSTDAAAIDARIDAALKSTGDARGLHLDSKDMIVIGESMGAARAELLASKYPDKYTRLVLVGSPQTPSPKNLHGAKAVANLAGEKEEQATMKQGTRALEAAGTPSRFWELPAATHGEYGPEGKRIMSEALGFVAAR